MSVDFKRSISVYFANIFKRDFSIALAVLGLIFGLLFLPLVVGKKTILPTNVILSVDQLYHKYQFAQEAGGNGLLSDLVEYMYPSVYFANETISSGKLPLWNPYIMAGSPFLANAQSAIFEITKIFAYIIKVDSVDFFVFSSFLTLFLGGIFTYFFARQITISNFGAIISSIIFTLSGPMIVWLGYPLPSCFIWLPLILLCIHKVITQFRLLWIVVAAFAVSAQLYAGHPQSSFFIILVVLSYGLFQMCLLSIGSSHGTHNFAHQSSAIIVTFLLGLALAMPQIVPTIEYIMQSDALQKGRGGYGQTNVIQAIQDGAINPWNNRASIRTNLGDLLLVLYPNLFGNPIGGYLYGYKQSGSNPGRDNYNENASYIGVVAVVLALLAIVFYKKGNRSQILFWFFALLFSLLIYIDFPVINLLRYLPVLNMVNLERLRYVFVFSMAILAGYGVDILLKEYQQYRLRIPLQSLKHLSRNYAIPIPQSEILFFYIVLASLVFPILLAYALFPEGFLRDVIWIFVALAILIFSAILDVIKFQFDGIFLKIGLFIAIVGQLLYYGIIYHPGSSKKLVYPKTKAIEFLQQNIGFNRVTSYKKDKYSYLTSLLPNSSTIWHLQDIRGYDVLAPHRYEIVQEFMAGAVTEGMAPHRVSYDAFRENFFSLFGVKYFVQSKDDLENIELQSRPELKLVYSDNTSSIYENTDVMPRAFMAYNVQMVQSPEEALNAFNDSQYDVKKTALIEISGPTDDMMYLASRIEDMPIVQPAEIVKYENEQVEIAVNTDKDGVLVLTDSYYPGWRAFVDGQESIIYPADIAFRGVFVPNGKHKVVFIYRPTYWVASVISAIIAASIVLILLIIDVLKYKKPRIILNNSAIS